MWCEAYFTNIEKDVCNKVVVQYSTSDFDWDIESQALHKEEYVHGRELDEALSTCNKKKQI